MQPLPHTPYRPRSVDHPTASSSAVHRRADRSARTARSAFCTLAEGVIERSQPVDLAPKTRSVRRAAGPKTRSRSRTSYTEPPTSRPWCATDHCCRVARRLSRPSAPAPASDLTAKAPARFLVANRRRRRKSPSRRDIAPTHQHPSRRQPGCQRWPRKVRRLLVGQITALRTRHRQQRRQTQPTNLRQWSVFHPLGLPRLHHSPQQSELTPLFALLFLFSLGLLDGRISKLVLHRSKHLAQIELQVRRQ